MELSDDQDPHDWKRPKGPLTDQQFELALRAIGHVHYCEATQKMSNQLQGLGRPVDVHDIAFAVTCGTLDILSGTFDIVSRQHGIECAREWLRNFIRNIEKGVNAHKADMVIEVRRHE